MTAKPQRLSPGSLERYRAVVRHVATQFGAAWAGKMTVRIGLVDRKNRNAVALLDLADGSVRLPTSEMFDLIFVEQARPGDRNDPDFIQMKTRLEPDGVILLKRGRIIFRWLGHLLSRRREDAEGRPFGRGHDRREAALRRASLYLMPITTTVGCGKEKWLVASTSPIEDQRFRDQIGRVATDYPRALTPVTIGVATNLPSLRCYPERLVAVLRFNQRPVIGG